MFSPSLLIFRVASAHNRRLPGTLAPIIRPLICFIVGGLLIPIATPDVHAQGSGKKTSKTDEIIPRARALKEEFCLLIEPTYRRSELARPIEGAKQTQLVPAFEGGLEFEYYDQKKFAGKKVTWADYYRRSLNTATRILETLKPHIIRDKEKKPVCVILTSKSQLTASAMLAPGFLKKLSQDLGPSLHVVIPDRYTIYTFAKGSDVLNINTETMIRVFRNSAYPVSLEIFEIDKEGFRVVGKIESE